MARRPPSACANCSSDWGAVPQKPKTAPTPQGFLNAAMFNVDEYGSAVSLARVLAAHGLGHPRAPVGRHLAHHRRIAPAARERAGHGKDLGRGPLDEPEILERADIALQAIASISGLAQENMNRVAGWRFLEIGRRLERGVNACRIVRHFGMEQARVTDFDVLLDLIDSQITYRSRYLVGVAPYPVRDMALLDPYNPRSAAFQTARLAEHIATLPVLKLDGMLEPPNRIAIETQRRSHDQGRVRRHHRIRSLRRAPPARPRRRHSRALFPPGRQ